MSVPPLNGVDAVCQHFAGILRSYLQDALDAQCAAAKVAWRLRAPEDSNVVVSRSWTQPQRANAIQVYSLRSDGRREEWLNVGAPMRVRTDVEVRCFVFEADASRLDRARELFAAAVSSVLEEWWRVGNDAHITAVTYRVEQQASSEKARAGVVGMLARTLKVSGLSQSNIDPVSVVATVDHWTAQTVQF